MSEPSFPFGGQTPAGRPVGAEGAPETGQDSKRRNLVIGGVAAAAAVAVAGGAFLLMSGGGDATPTSTAIPKGRPAVAATATSAAPTETIPDTFDGVVGSDPFHALVVPAAAVSAPPATPTPAPSTPAPAPTIVVALPGPTVTVTAKPTAPATWTVKIVRVAPDNSSADISVNGTTYSAVKPDDKPFTTNFSLMSLTGGKDATIHFGDTFFGLSLGQSLTVQ